MAIILSMYITYVELMVYIVVFIIIFLIIPCILAG